VSTTGNNSDWFLTTMLAGEDLAEDHHGASPHERLTCRLHRRWAHECITSPAHVIPVTGHRWCRRCRTSAAVVVDEVAGTVRLACRRCGRTPRSAASDQIVRACRGSFAAARARRHTAGRSA
jgi:hypothetical protein